MGTRRGNLTAALISVRIVVLVVGAECIDSKREVLELIETELSIRKISVQFITFNVGKW